MENTIVARMDFDNLGANKNKRVKVWFDSMSLLGLGMIGPRHADWIAMVLQMFNEKIPSETL